MARANSAKTAAAVEAARRALDAAVETASAAVETAETETTAAETGVNGIPEYTAAQTAILDGLEPINASLASFKTANELHSDLLTVKPALSISFSFCIFGCEARRRYNAAVKAAQDAMARAEAERTAALINEARRFLAALAQAGQAALDEARRTLVEARRTLIEARKYRTEQTPLIAAIPTQPETPPSSPLTQSRVADLNVTHSTTTDLLGRGGLRLMEYDCSASGCTWTFSGDTTRFEDELDDVLPLLEGASDLTNGFSSLVPSGTINGVELFTKTSEPVLVLVPGFPDFTNYGTAIGGVGQYSLFYTNISYSNGPTGSGTPFFSGNDAAAAGERSASKPPSSGTWAGAMVGTSNTDSGPALAGEVVVRYGFANSNIDVDMDNIRSYNDVSYTGPSSFSWRGLQVQSDGWFHQAGSGNDHITGNFYGPAATETAGVFERGSVTGAWLARTTGGSGVATGSGDDGT